jgi:hypothetical protein
MALAIIMLSKLRQIHKDKDVISCRIVGRKKDMKVKGGRLEMRKGEGGGEKRIQVTA